MPDDRHLRGSTEKCPKCGCRTVAWSAGMAAEGYGPGIATCKNCGALWEPFDPAEIWDPDDPLCAFRLPCNNCAFRKSSPERADPAKWAALVAKLEAGTSFHCHKGVPIDPEAEHGFAYPTRHDGTPDRKRLRLCRGYLNAVVGRQMRKAG